MTLNPLSAQICTCKSRIFHTSCERHFQLHPQCTREALEKALILVRKMHMCTFSFRILYQTGFFSLLKQMIGTGCTVFGVTSLIFFMKMMLEAVSKERLTWEEAEFLQTSLRLVEKGSPWYQEEGYLKGHVWEKKCLRVALHVVVTLKTANCRSSIYFYVEIVKK